MQLENCPFATIMWKRFRCEFPSKKFNKKKMMPWKWVLVFPKTINFLAEVNRVRDIKNTKKTIAICKVQWHRFAFEWKWLLAHYVMLLLLCWITWIYHYFYYVNDITETAFVKASLENLPNIVFMLQSRFFLVGWHSNVYHRI